MSARRRFRQRRRTPTDAGAKLARMLAADADAHGIHVACADWQTQGWSSPTFVGDRHEAVLTATGEGVAGWCVGARGLDLRLSGHLLADLQLRPMADGTVHLSALTLADA